MGFAEDKVYKYIIQNLGNFKNIRVASLADSLSCLTDADRVIPRFPTLCRAPSIYILSNLYMLSLTSKPDLLDPLCVFF